MTQVAEGRFTRRIINTQRRPLSYLHDVDSKTDRERPNVSSPIRSIKMYSYAQCTMQERLECCGDVSCLAHMEQGSGPLHSEHLPLS